MSRSTRRLNRDARLESRRRGPIEVTLSTALDAGDLRHFGDAAQGVKPVKVLGVTIGRKATMRRKVGA